MGNYISNHKVKSTTGKVLLRDGTIHEFDQPITAAELMLEHPQQVVVDYQSVLLNQRGPILPADKKLEGKNVYLMLPLKKGKPTLSTLEAQQMLQKANSLLRSSKSSTAVSISGFLVLVASKLCYIGKVEKHSGAGKEQAVECLQGRSKIEFPIEDSEGGSEYLSRHISSKGWKPSLDTIKEKKAEKKVFRRGYLVTLSLNRSSED